jgi:hypothetical protein
LQSRSSGSKRAARASDGFAIRDCALEETRARGRFSSLHHGSEAQLADACQLHDDRWEFY